MVHIYNVAAIIYNVERRRRQNKSKRRANRQKRSENASLPPGSTMCAPALMSKKLTGPIACGGLERVVSQHVETVDSLPSFRRTRARARACTRREHKNVNPGGGLKDCAKAFSPGADKQVVGDFAGKFREVRI